MERKEYGSRDEYFGDVAYRPRAKTEDKPVVKYKRVPGVTELRVNGSATIIPVDHPAGYLNGRIAHTSYIMAVGTDGSFETRNTRYELAE